jgi:hypothetical protein
VLYSFLALEKFLVEYKSAVEKKLAEYKCNTNTAIELKLGAYFLSEEFCVCSPVFNRAFKIGNTA